MAAFDFAPVADSSQLVKGPTHRAGGVFDLVLTNFLYLCDVHVHGNVGRSDHALLGVVLNLSPTVAGFDVARRVTPKSRVNWNAVCKALSGLNWRSILRSPTIVQDFDMEVSRIKERFVPTVTVRRGGDAAWFDGDCRRAFDLKQSAYHRWFRNLSALNWDSFCHWDSFKLLNWDSFKLSRLFRRLLRCSEFPLEWWIANVTFLTVYS